MKTRHQILVIGAKFVSLTLFAALLGVGSGNFVRNNQKLLAKAPTVVVIQNETAKDLSFTQLKDSKCVLSSIKTYTQKEVLISTFVTPREIVMNAIEARRQDQRKITLNNIYAPRVSNNYFPYKARGDSIPVNTS